MLWLHGISSHILSGWSEQHFSICEPVGSMVACQRKEGVVSICLCLCFPVMQDSLKDLKPAAFLALGRLLPSLSGICSYAALCTAGTISLWVSFLKNKLLSVHTPTPALWLTLELSYFSFSFGISFSRHVLIQTFEITASQETSVESTPSLYHLL